MAGLKTNRISVWLALGLLSAAQAWAQMGGVRGVVMDQDFGVPLPGVKVRVSETGQETATGDTGSFYLEQLAPGAYTLLFSKSGYTRITRPEVVVTAGQLTEVEAALAGEYEEMDELVVRDIQLGGASEIGLLNLRMESPALMDSVGADMMSQAGASDAAGALKLVAGATVQDGKYAVVRGLPDRYVSSQMNSVRLPTADPDKRAVQLDQFPAAMIESMQVAKTFTPDQQGDASGGAVNVVLKGIPDEPVLQAKAGTKFNTGINGEPFLTYQGGGNSYLGIDNGSRNPQVPDTVWKGAYGVKEGTAPFMYDWNVTAGGKDSLIGDLRVGAMANLFYKQDASSFNDGISDKYWLEPYTKVGLVPAGLVDRNRDGVLEREDINIESLSSLYDVRKSSDKVQWGWLAAVGAENEWNRLTLLHMRTHNAEDKATLAEDTRGREQYVGTLPYRRSHTLEYIERDTDSLQLSARHTIPLPELDAAGFTLLHPEIDWTAAKSSSELDSPDKRIFSVLWEPEVINPGGREYVFNPVTGGFEWVITPPTTNSASYREDKPNASTLGGIQRIWKNIREDSDQFFVNGRIPFEQWSREEGFVKLGYFTDRTVRRFDQDTFSNTRPFGDIFWDADWSEYWSDAFYEQGLANPGAQQYQMHETNYDVDYIGRQEISAWYYMIDLPLTTFFKVTGGTRVESTSMQIEFDAEDDVLWYDFKNGALSSFQKNPPPNIPIDQTDVLPSVGFECRPLGSVTLRGNYSETIARPTFKEYSPIAQFEYVGGDIFIGNSALTMSALENYDLRADWVPYAGSLVSVSWFMKNIEDPIEYTQKSADNVGIFTSSVNYPDGRIEGYEFEVRQHLGQFLSALEGLSIGGNLTLIDSEVTIPADEVARYISNNYGFVETTRDMLNAPEYLYNLYTTYDIAHTGTRLGLFYTVKGDTLVAGPSTFGEYIPSVYAREYGTLNFTVSQRLTEHWSLSFKIKNLTNPEIQEVYRAEALGEEALKSSYTQGVEYSVGLSGSW